MAAVTRAAFTIAAVCVSLRIGSAALNHSKHRWSSIPVRFRD